MKRACIAFLIAVAVLSIVAVSVPRIRESSVRQTRVSAARATIPRFREPARRTPAIAPTQSAGPRAIFSYPTQPAILPPNEKSPRTASREKEAGGRNKWRRSSSRDDKTTASGNMALFEDDFESGRIGKAWHRQHDERSKCQVTANKRAGNHFLLLKTAKTPYAQFVAASTGSPAWRDYEVTFRFRMVKGDNVCFEFRSSRARGFAALTIVRDAIRVQTEDGALAIASEADGVLGQGIPVPFLSAIAKEDEESAGRWYSTRVALRGNQFDLELAGSDGDSRPGGGGQREQPLLHVSRTTKVSRGGIAFGVYRGEMWVDDIRVHRL